MSGQWIQGNWPDYRQLRRYRPDRRLGPLGISWNPDHLPWPQVHCYQSGGDVCVGLTFGPLGPDPAFALDLTVKRPGAAA